MDVYDKVVVVKLNMSSWVGRVSVPGAGMTDVIPATALRPFGALKQRAVRVCHALGPRFMDGYAILEEDIDGLCDELDNIRKAYAHERARFLDSFEESYHSFIERYRTSLPGISHIRLTAAGIGRKFGFDWMCMKVFPYFEEDETMLLHAMYEETAAVFLSVSRTFVWPEAGQTTGNGITAVSRALRGLSSMCGRFAFLGNAIGFVQGCVEYSINRLLKTDNVRLATLANVLSDVANVERLVVIAAHGHAPADTVAELLNDDGEVEESGMAGVDLGVM